MVPIYHKHGARLTATTIGNLALFAGGETYSGVASDVVDIYNFTSNTWSNLGCQNQELPLLQLQWENCLFSGAMPSTILDVFSTLGTHQHTLQIPHPNVTFVR